MSRSISILKTLSEEAYNTVPDLVEAWQIMSPSDLTTNKVELKIVARATFGNGANMKLDLINLIQERLKREGIAIID